MTHLSKHSRSRLLAVIGLAALIASFAAGRALAGQPHMQNALAALENARSELNAAERNKNGHRERALELVDGAIKQVRQGIAAGR